MKKYLLLASAATLFMASCSDEFNPSIEGNTVLDGKSKIHATFPLGLEEEGDGTRTTVVPVGNGEFKYKWGAGDALGVWGFTTEDEATNENYNNYMRNVMYSYDSGLDSFVGQVYLETNKQYFAYYPYSAAFGSDEGCGFMIPEYQSFNNVVIKNNITWQWDYPTGSFANGTAPAVAIGTAENDEDLNLSLDALGSYLVFPIQGYGTVQRIKLVVENDNNIEGIQKMIPDYSWPGYGLWGLYETGVSSPSELKDELDYYILEKLGTAKLPELTAEEYQQYLVEYLTDPSDNSETTLEGNNEIILNCGAGVKLSPNEPINFWFVVNPNTPLSGSTISLYINDDTTPITKTFAADWNQGKKFKSDGQSKMIAARNHVRWIQPAVNTAFEWNEYGGYIITNPWQFLEYAYLVTNGESVLKEWQALYEAANDPNNDGVTTAPTMDYTDLENMLNLPEGEELSSLKDFTNVTVKDAYIAPALRWSSYGENTLPFSTEIIGDYLGTGSGAWTLATYYMNVYGKYIQSAEEGSTVGYIPTIGTGYNYVINGAIGSQEMATLSGLGITSATNKGIFIGGGSKTQSKVENITLDKFIVDATSATPYNKISYCFLANPTWNTFNNITINDNCVLNVPEGNYKKYIFNFVNTSQFSQGIFADSSYPEDAFKFANTLQVTNASFSFPANNVRPQAFDNINITSNGEGSVLTVAPTDNAQSVDALYLIENANNGNYYYSVIDGKVGEEGTTSYWTGTKAKSARSSGYAEDLAYANENRGTFIFTVDIDLMGNNNKVWNTYGPKSNLAITSNNFTISNIVMNGAGTTGAVYLSLFGQNASVQGEGLTVENITINNVNVQEEGEIISKANSAARIGAISGNLVKPGLQNITVNGLVVNAEVAYNNAIGGLVMSIENPSVVSLIDNCKVTSGYEFNVPDAAEDSEQIKCGEIAGQLRATVDSVDDNVITNPFAITENMHPYGILLITVNSTIPSQNGGTIQGATLNLVDFDETTFEDVQLVKGQGVENGYTFIIQSNGKTSLIYRYDSTKGWYEVNL